MTTRDMKNLHLSILIPVYNSEKTIGHLVDNIVEVITPLVHLHEIVLVNDGSVDKSHEVILEAIEKHPNIYYQQSVALNKNRKFNDAEVALKK